MRDFAQQLETIALYTKKMPSQHPLVSITITELKLETIAQYTKEMPSENLCYPLLQQNSNICFYAA